MDFIKQAEKEAREVAKKHRIEIRPLKKEFDYFFNDDEEKGHKRDIYTVLITSHFHGFTYTFGVGLDDSTGITGQTVFYYREIKPRYAHELTFGDTELRCKKEESAFYTNEEPELYYSILSVIQKYELEDFEDFIFEYGYNEKKEMTLLEARKEYDRIFDIYKKAKEEYENFSKLFKNDIIPDDILEIC